MKKPNADTIKVNDIPDLGDPDLVMASRLLQGAVKTAAQKELAKRLENIDQHPLLASL